MKLSSLACLLKGSLEPCEFIAEIHREFTVYQYGLQERGCVAPVEVTEDSELRLDSAGLKALCRLYTESKLTATELAYIADVLQLAELVYFSDSSVADVVAEMTDPEINGEFSVVRALEIANECHAV